jgi:carboxyl-terminal processing protease
VTIRQLFRSTLLTLALGVGCIAATDRNYTTTPVMSNEARALVQMLDLYHYKKDALTQADYTQLITEFMADLDPVHLFFTAQDEQALRQQYGPRVMTDLAYLGNIDAAFAIFNLYEQRVQSRTAWIFSELAKDFDFTAKEQFTPDRSASSWPLTGEAADDLWRKRLKYEMLSHLLDGKTVEEAKAFSHKRYERNLKNTAEFDASDIQEYYLTSLTKMYDPHSSFFSADTLEDFSIQMRLSLVGIGAVLGIDDDGFCVIKEVVPGGPADLSGLIKANDKITIVQQPNAEPVDIVGMKLRRIVEMIRGKKATQVVLTIQTPEPGGSSKTKQVTIIRDVIKLNSARATASIYEVPAADGVITPVGVIGFNSFYGPSDDSTDSTTSQSSLTSDVAELIGKLQKSGIKALVIDLRHNGGGFLSEAVSLTGLFIGKGPVVQVKDSQGRLMVDNNTETPLSYDGPLAVLTSRFSASASEIFAGALQNYGRAVIVGDSSTHGKGSVQQVYEMKDYIPRFTKTKENRTGAAKLTVQKYYLPSGASTQNKGVIPDVTLPSIDDYLPHVGESNLPHALVWDEIRSAKFEGKPLAPIFVKPLTHASQERQKSLEEFSLLMENVNRFKEQTEQKSVSLHLEDRRTQKKSDEEFKKRLQHELARLAKTDFTHQDVKLNSVLAAEAAGQKPAPAVTEGDTDSIEEETAAKLDIHLREALRVVIDAAQLAKDPQYWVKGDAPLAPVGSKRG